MHCWHTVPAILAPQIWWHHITSAPFTVMEPACTGRAREGISRLPSELSEARAVQVFAALRGTPSTVAASVAATSPDTLLAGDDVVLVALMQVQLRVLAAFDNRLLEREGCYAVGVSHCRGQCGAGGPHAGRCWYPLNITCFADAVLCATRVLCCTALRESHASGTLDAKLCIYTVPSRNMNSTRLACMLLQAISVGSCAACRRLLAWGCSHARAGACLYGLSWSRLLCPDLHIRSNFPVNS